MTSGGWPPPDPSQYDPGRPVRPGPDTRGSYNPGQHDPGQYNPGPWSAPSAPGAANAGPWNAGPPPQSPPAMPPTSYLPASGYRQPGAYPPGNAYPGTADAQPPAPSTTGIVVASVGAALAVLGLFLDWYASGSAHAGVKELAQAAKLDGAPGLAHLYFGWALWVVLAIAIAVAISANLAGSSVAPLAIAGALAGVVSTGLTYAALNSGRASGSPFDHAAVGLWLFLLGPLILAAGALVALARRTG